VHFLRDMLGHVAKAQQAVDRHGDPPGLRRRLGRRGFRAPGGGGGAPRGPGAEGGRLLEEARARRPGLLRLPPRALGRSCARPTRSSASTARSAGARTSSASSPTTRP
jgi:hypothetical protein